MNAPELEVFRTTYSVAVRLALTLLMMLLIVASRPALSQHNQDALLFQGLLSTETVTTRALGMGGAGIGLNGDVSGGYNPAGLSGMDGLQINIDGRYARRSWQEEQEWYPDRGYKLYPLMMERHWMPRPEWSDASSDSLLTYLVNPGDIGLPVQGADPYDPARADWLRQSEGVTFSNVSVGLPFEVASRSFAAAVSFRRHLDVHDFDRNDTSLDPHPGVRTSLTAAPSDTVRINWWQYERERTGGIYALGGTLAGRIVQHISGGIQVNILQGKTEDRLHLAQVGTFDFVPDQSVFSFAYASADSSLAGSSHFSAVQVGAGLMVDYERVGIGLTYRLPFTLQREWRFRHQGMSGSRKLEGTDRVNVPARYGAGLRFLPHSSITLVVDIEHSPFSNAEFDLESTPSDSSYRSAIHWVDRTVLRAGVEVRPLPALAVRAGYRNEPQVFIPAGAPLRYRGPEAVSYTLGLSISIWEGNLDFALENRRLKYWDQYESNTNYALSSMTQLHFGYRLTL